MTAPKVPSRAPIQTPRALRTLWLVAGLTVLASGGAGAFEPRVLDSVVSVLPLWPGHAQGGRGDVPPGAAPEGSAVAIAEGGYLVTAFHVIDRATRVDVRLHDGTVHPARIVGQDPATDLAVLRIDRELPLLAVKRDPGIAEPVCAIGNQFGLDLSVTCGVVSATRRSGVGFNPIEDFVQTDAVVNPGSSGGALVDGEGRLVGILSAIFTKDSDADIGVNFAASMALVLRVVDDLIAHGRVLRAAPGLRVADLELGDRRTLTGARVVGLLPDGPASRAGIALGDVVTAIAGRPVRGPHDVTAGVQLHRPGDSLTVTVLREGRPLDLTLTLPPVD